MQSTPVGLFGSINLSLKLPWKALVDKGLGNVVFSETPSRFLSPAGVLGAPIADLVG